MKTVPQPTSHGSPVTEDTRAALMDAAERLFAENGLEGASVREITKTARANLGAVNYHFGTKDGLILAVFSRRLKPINERRVAMLDALEAKAADRPLPLEKVLDAFLRPMIEQQGTGLEDGQAFTRLMSRVFQEPNPQVAQLVCEQFGTIVKRINTALLKAVPTLPPDEVFWRISFLFGSAHHAIDAWSRFDTNPFARIPGAPVPRALDREALLQRLIAYAAAGIRGTST
ncbi:MAG: transcriptional regulator, TetR family [Verrucomicrobiales bacterium]|nr:transcriptional regulator, TetR family [Verrucomicrobiales bacterium]